VTEAAAPPTISRSRSSKPISPRFAFYTYGRATQRGRFNQPPKMRHLHIDIETYSSVDLPKCGVHKYAASVDFEILLFAYAFDDAPVSVVDLTTGAKIPDHVVDAMLDDHVLKFAHNATFERVCLRAVGVEVPAAQWYCTAAKARYCGLPGSLGDASKALALGENGKSAAGKALIRYFCIPCKPTKTNGGRLRNLPTDAPEKWADFAAYCAQDVEAERHLAKRLEGYEIPQWERDLYATDQKINDRGVLIDVDLAERATATDVVNGGRLSAEMTRISGVKNPNSPAQLKAWITEATGATVKGLAKADVENLLLEVGAGAVRDVLELRQKAAKSSVKKYAAMIQGAGADHRARGLFQFYGASRTGRWAGRRIQLQNLPRNYMRNLDAARRLVRDGHVEDVGTIYDDVGDVLSQLVRTALIPSPGQAFVVSDFSAIEARVIAWLAREAWRMEVFRTHGKIYEASASKMFNVPIESVTKGSDLRSKGKVAELALGYQGAVGALKAMGGEKMGLNEAEMSGIVKRWRKANPAIVQLWYDTDDAAQRAIRVRGKKTATKCGRVTFLYDGVALIVTLPSGRALHYRAPKIADGRFGTVIKYQGVDQKTSKWGRVETYGGKLVENIVQAIARDLLAYSIIALDANGFDVVGHVHDEVIVEVAKETSDFQLEIVEEIMGQAPPWASDLPLGADGYVTNYYKKD
jgi:DNA polymerase